MTPQSLDNFFVFFRFEPSAAISSGEKGAEEMVDIEPLEKWDKPNFTDFLPKPGTTKT
jgi:hypothetical protein